MAKTIPGEIAVISDGIREATNAAVAMAAAVTGPCEIAAAYLALLQHLAGARTELRRLHQAIAE